MKRLLSIAMAFTILFSLSACGEKTSETEIELDLDTIATSLSASGYFPENLEIVDSGFVPGLLSLYEDRIEATPEDLGDARYAFAVGVVADQFILLEGIDAEAADRLEKALGTYAEDQKSSFEFYSPDQAARLDDPIIERQGRYLLFAIGEDQKSLSDLCTRLMNGETIEFEKPAQSQMSDSPHSDATQPEDITDKDAPIEEPDTFSSADVEAAHQAALDYYAGTVFEIHSLTRIDPWGSWKGDVLFRVVCSKSGEPQTDRTIALERQDGIWTVINEGY